MYLDLDTELQTGTYFCRNKFQFNFSGRQRGVVTSHRGLSLPSQYMGIQRKCSAENCKVFFFSSQRKEYSYWVSLEEKMSTFRSFWLQFV